jgi:hypothetical protein
MRLVLSRSSRLGCTPIDNLSKNLCSLSLFSLAAWVHFLADHFQDIVAVCRLAGAALALLSHVACTDCNTRYHPTYFVHSNASTRTYYQPDSIDFIPKSRHYVIERSLCEIFATMMMSSQYVPHCATI